jgi:transposase, IS5 family
MKQQDLGLDLSKRRTRKMELLELMDSVVPWPELVAMLTALAPVKATGRPPFAHETMLRLHLLQQLFGLSDFAMEEALFETPLYRDFAGLDANARLPDRVSILRFRHRLEKHKLAQQFFDTVNAMLKARRLMLHSGTVIDATIIAAPSSTKNSSGKRDPEMHQTKKGNQWHHGMKGHTGVDADSGLVHSVATTAANAHDVTQASQLLHGEETDVFADSGYRGVEKREEIQAKHPDVNWHIAMMPGKRKAMDKSTPMGAILEQLEKTKARIRAKVEHPFRVIKRQFGYTKVRYRGLAKNTAQLYTLFMLSNLWMVRKRCRGAWRHECVCKRPKRAKGRNRVRKPHAIDAKSVEFIEIDTAVSVMRDSSDQDRFGDEF